MKYKNERGNNLQKVLVDVCDRFSEWMITVQVILKMLKNYKETIATIKELDDSMVEL